MSAAENIPGHANSSTTVKHGGKSRSLGGAIEDLVSGALQWRIWLSLAWEDLKTTYRRSVLGVLWVVLGFALFVFAKVLIFSAMLKTGRGDYYYAYLATGFFIWRILSNGIASAPMSFVKYEAWIKNDSLPLSIYVYRAVTRELFTALFTSVVVVAVYLYLQTEIGPYAYMTIPAFLVIILNLIWVKLFLGILSARYRDITHLVQSVMAVMLFLSPIFWMPEQIGDVFKYLWWNPIFHFMEILRNPILDKELTISSWKFVGVVTTVGWTATLALFSVFRRRIVFWL